MTPSDKEVTKCSFLLCAEWYDGPFQAAGYFSGAGPIVCAFLHETDPEFNKNYLRVYAARRLSHKEFSDGVGFATVLDSFSHFGAATIRLDEAPNWPGAFYGSPPDCVVAARRLEEGIDLILERADLPREVKLDWEVSIADGASIRRTVEARLSDGRV
jgi:hypothetical protein